MKHPKIENTPQLINLNNKDTTSPSNSQRSEEEIRWDGMIIDLKLKDLSYREIQDFMLKFENRRISKENIADTLIAAGKRAKQLNHFYDHLALKKTSIAEGDEVFQGRKNCLLGIVDKDSSYLFSLDFLENRQIPTLTTHFKQFASKTPELQIFITDGLPAYPAAVKAAFEDIVYLQCNVHALRTIFSEQDDYKRRSKKAYRSLKAGKIGLQKLKDKLLRKRKDYRNLGRKRERLKKKRDEYYRRQGIKPYSKKIVWTSPLKRFKSSLSALNSSIRSKLKTITNLKAKIERKKGEICSLEQDYMKIHQENMQAGRLVARFKGLFRSSAESYEVEKSNFIAILDRSPLDIAKKIKKYMKRHPQIFALQQAGLDEFLAYNYRNTNTIERIFGIFRNFLNKLKRITQTSVGKALFELLRFRYNFTPPKTGFHNHESPLQRIGINSQYTTYLDALFNYKRAQTIDCMAFPENGSQIMPYPGAFILPTKI